MNDGKRLVEWDAQGAHLCVVEPMPEEVAAAAGRLVGYYNEPHNRIMMAHAGVLSVEDVLDHYQKLWNAGDRPLLLYRDDVLVGDADLRGVLRGQEEMP